MNATLTTTATASPHTRLIVHCASCQRAVELESEGLPGFWGYETYNVYVCPHCRKQNHHKTSGAIVSARIPTAAI